MVEVVHLSNIQFSLQVFRSYFEEVQLSSIGVLVNNSVNTS